MSGVAHCKGCGKKILYVRMPSGNDMPVDMGVQIVAVDMDEGNNFIGSTANANPNVGVAYGINHFMNCTRANEFSKGHKAKDPSAAGIDHQTKAAGEGVE